MICYVLSIICMYLSLNSCKKG